MNLSHFLPGQVSAIFLWGQRMKEGRYNIRLKKFLLDWPLKLFSIIVATLIWSWVQSAELTNSTAQIPLRVELPENLLPMQAIPKSIFVEVTGPKADPLI